MSARLLVGDVFERLTELKDDSVDLVMGSPPFLALRSYLPDGHPDKGKEIGSEPTPAVFLDTLLHLTAALDRVIAPHGSLVFELGDTYSSSGGAGGDYRSNGLRGGQPKFKQAYSPAAWPLPKSLCGIPTLYAWSLAYGRNLLTGEPSPAGQWRIRNLVAWVRPNPPVGALGDKYRPATSYLVVACRSAKRWFDLDAVRVPGASFTRPEADSNGGKKARTDEHGKTLGLQRNGRPVGLVRHPAGAPPLDWWQITTRPYKGAHYAAYPPTLCERPIKSMCPLRVCTVCGEPSRRITGKSAQYMAHRNQVVASAANRNRAGERATNRDGRRMNAEYQTLGWTDCGHDAWRPGMVLDPFAGTGTTLLVANDNGRDAIGIDLDDRNAALALERVGPMLLHVDYGRATTKQETGQCT